MVVPKCLIRSKKECGGTNMKTLITILMASVLLPAVPESDVSGAWAHLAIVKGGGNADRPWRHDFNFRACRVWRLHRDVDRQGNPMDEEMIGDHVDHAARAAKLTLRGIHILRHSFCSHLAMRPA